MPLDESFTRQDLVSKASLCAICRRPLTNPVSIALGMGPSHLKSRNKNVLSRVDRHLARRGTTRQDAIKALESKTQKKRPKREPDSLESLAQAGKLRVSGRRRTGQGTRPGRPSRGSQLMRERALREVAGDKPRRDRPLSQRELEDLIEEGEKPKKRKRKSAGMTAAEIQRMFGDGPVE